MQDSIPRKGLLWQRHCAVLSRKHINENVRVASAYCLRIDAAAHLVWTRDFK